MRACGRARSASWLAGVRPALGAARGRGFERRAHLLGVARRAGAAAARLAALLVKQNALRRFSSFGSVSACPPAARAAACSSITPSWVPLGACERERQAGHGAVHRAAARARGELRVHAGELFTAFGELWRRGSARQLVSLRVLLRERAATAPHRTARRSRGGGANCTWPGPEHARRKLRLAL